VSETSGASKTVDLLIDLQPRTAGLAFDARPRPVQRPMRLGDGERIVLGQPAPIPSAGVLFGVGATPLPTGRGVAGANVEPSRNGAGGLGPGGGSAGTALNRPSPSLLADEAHGLQRWLRLPLEAIGYVRENRGFVLGLSVGLLALLGVATKVLARRR
jgi:hypothetical protein